MRLLSFCKSHVLTFYGNRYAGLETHLVLRNSRTLADKDPGLVGNLLVERLVGAHIHQVTKEEYVKHGSVHLGNLVVEQLKKEGKNPALIPVGGSNAIGTFGYLEFMRELHDQTADAPFTDIVMVSLLILWVEASLKYKFPSRFATLGWLCSRTLDVSAIWL